MSDFTNDFHGQTLVDLLRMRAEQRPDTVAFTFLSGNAEGGVRLTHARLDERARAIAAALRTRCAPGERALLLYPPGLDFVLAFFGCLYAGILPVPAYPPRHHQKLQRLQAILTDAEPTSILTVSASRASIAEHFAPSPGFDALWLLATDELEDGLASSWRRPELTGGSLAFLQYTSGSTSTPKGVMVSHENLLHNSRSIRAAFGLTPRDVSVTWLPSFHDMGLIDGILQPLYTGFPAVLMSPASFLQQPIRWLKAISDHRATHSGGPDFAYALCTQRTSEEQRQGLDLSCWTMAYNGAEPIRRATLEAFTATFAPHGFRSRFFYPCYGLAEATLMVTGSAVDEEPVLRDVDSEHLEHHQVVEATADRKHTTLVGSGRVHLDTRVEIVEPGARTRRTPGQVGEIWVQGQGVAQGYWRRPEESREVFQATLADTGAGPFLRTGDLGFVHDGELFVTGRLKDLLIIRGRNHYPQDLELTAARAHPALRPGGGAAFSVDVEGAEQLVLVHELDRGDVRTANLEEVATAVRRAIAEQHELSTHAVVLLKPGQMPKTSSGKLQRGACRARFLEGSLEEVGRSVLTPGADVPPPPPAREPLAEHLLRLVAQSLRLAPSQVEPERTLLELGMDSLAATELQQQVEREFGVSLSLEALLDDTRITRLVEWVRERRGDRAAAAAPAHRLEEGRSEAPVSRGQQALWFLHHLAPESAAYNVSFAVRVVSELEATDLREALRRLTLRHSALRTSFQSVQGQPVAHVQDTPVLDWEHLDASTWSPEAFDARLVEETHRPFALTRAPLLRVRLLRRGPRDQVLLLTAHHIVVDFRSLQVLLEELPDVYTQVQARQPPDSSSSSARMEEHARWQTDWLASPASEAQWNYWREQLAGAPPLLDLPTDRPRASVQGFRGAVHVSTWDARTVERLRAYATSRGVTPYTVLLAAFQVLLHRYTGQEDLLVGTSVAGRTRPEFAGTVGYLVNPLALRGRLAGGPSFDTYLRQVRRTVLDALAHQDYPFAALVERLRPGRDPSHTPLFQTMFVYEQPPRARPGSALFTHAPGARVHLGALTLEPFALEHLAAQFDLTLKVTASEEVMRAAWEYNADLFEPATLERMEGHLRRLLDALLTTPEQSIAELPLMGAEERHRLLVEWNDTDTPYPSERCLHELFEAQVARTPDATAVEQDGQRLSYRQLNTRANQVAHALVARGLPPEGLVGVCLTRSPELLVALLGVLKAGGAYVPLDPSYPARRLSYLLEDANVVALLTRKELLAKLPPCGRQVLCLDTAAEELARHAPHDPTGRAAPERLAYTLYTSGSTGRPKGVMIEHRGLVNYLAWCTRAYGADGGTGAPLVTSIGFDATLTGLFAPLLTGKRVVLLPEQGELAALTEALRNRSDFSLVKLTPAHLDLLREAMPAEQAEGGTRAFIVGGEALTREGVTFWRTHAPGTRIINEYGPTETVVGCCVHEVTSLAFSTVNVPIGRPIANTRLYVLDARLRPVPIGVVGELYIGGAGVARGYLHRPELTAERFLCDPFSSRPGARLYKTGDRVRYLADGTLDFLGRADDQVKLRGFRVEPGEVEATLRQHPALRDAAVTVQREPGGDLRLVAYVVPREASEQNLPAQVRRFLADRLPSYMVPASLVALEQLPLTPHGKLDRGALPPVEPSRPALEAAYVGPSSGLEQLIARIWRDVLRLDTVGVQDNFFDLGGHSLLAARVRHQLEEQLGREVSLVQLLQYPTIRTLADFLGRGRETAVETRSIQDRIQKQKQALQAIRKKREHS